MPGNENYSLYVKIFEIPVIASKKQGLKSHVSGVSQYLLAKLSNVFCL